ncbi:MAG TPA: DUF1223 domain-containing protein [Thermoanaerobaculia bacterium]|nr:DUF1223 domain-containing protein [Thermoanaerobaculia bacterium]
MKMLAVLLSTVVVELFTSQGCSSCPPADRLLSRLAHEDVIPLAYHVDYWNHLGWSDPFSSPRWSERQRAYAQALRTPQVYTPQAIVNGQTQLVGSAERAIRDEIARQRALPERGVVSIERISRVGNELHVDLRARGAANLVVTLFENGITTKVSAGENANRALTDDAIVRWQLTQSATTTSIKIPLHPSWRADHLGVVAYLQDPRTLAIFGAASRRVP